MEDFHLILATLKLTFKTEDNIKYLINKTSRQLSASD